MTIIDKLRTWILPSVDYIILVIFICARVSIYRRMGNRTSWDYPFKREQRI